MKLTRATLRRMATKWAAINVGECKLKPNDVVSNVMKNKFIIPFFRSFVSSCGVSRESLYFTFNPIISHEVSENKYYSLGPVKVGIHKTGDYDYTECGLGEINCEGISILPRKKDFAHYHVYHGDCSSICWGELEDSAAARHKGDLFAVIKNMYALLSTMNFDNGNNGAQISKIRELEVSFHDA